MSNIKTDNTKTLENALAEITRLKSEIEALKAANRDLQDWFDDARATAENAQARVAEMEADDNALDKMRGAFIIRKQAEAVEAFSEYEGSSWPATLAKGLSAAAKQYAQRLRQQANELERNP